ncbi:MAG: hypothetical protein HY676_00200 [Chloroflexi bacterium]|nr:hypothetical protein [Chloroflexota bacterium]
MDKDTASIIDLPRLVGALPPQEKELFHRLFHLQAVTGYLQPTPDMEELVRENFGSVQAVKEQKIIKILNKVTLEGTLFNKLRASRPVSARERLGALAQIIDDSIRIVEPLDNPLAKTPEDTFGRVRGRYCLSAANIAKYDGLHAMIVIEGEHNPLVVSWKHFDDMLDVAWRWLAAAHKADSSARYPFFLWNCLWRAGATLIHTHSQVMLGRGQHYAKVEAQRLAALAYKKEHGSDYFQDLYRVHQALGLAFERDGCQLLIYLTPIKEKEVIILTPEMGRGFKQLVFDALTCYRQSLRAVSFNLAIFGPPLAPTPESWEGFPMVARLVDRGDLTSRASDIGTMELYAQSVVASDPFQVAHFMFRTCGLTE